MDSTGLRMTSRALKHSKLSLRETKEYSKHHSLFQSDCMRIKIVIQRATNNVGFANNTDDNGISVDTTIACR